MEVIHENHISDLNDRLENGISWISKTQQQQISVSFRSSINNSRVEARAQHFVQRPALVTSGNSFLCLLARFRYLRGCQMSYERFRYILSPWASFVPSILGKRHRFTFIICSPVAVFEALVVIIASFKSASESHVHVNILCRIKRSFHRFVTCLSILE